MFGNTVTNSRIIPVYCIKWWFSITENLVSLKIIVQDDKLALQNFFKWYYECYLILLYMELID